MSLTTFQQSRRAGRVTASNVPAICGLDPFKSPRMAFDEITGRGTFKGNEFTALGDDMEEACAKAFTRATGKQLTRRGINRGTEATLVRATLDFVVVDEDAACECKTRGIANPWNIASQYGESGTDHAPMRDRVQVVAQQIACPEMEVSYISAIVGGLGHRWYVIRRNAEDIQAVTESVEKFVRDHLEPDVPPAPDYRDLDVINAVQRRTGSWAQIDETLFNDLVAARDVRLQAEKSEATLEARIKDAMKVGESWVDEGRCATGIVTFRQVKDQDKFDKEAFATAHPELLAAFTKRTPGYRRLLIKPAKGG